MFEATALLFTYVETPLHAGTARGLGAVDLPIQRERTTEYPMIQGSSLKGRLRAEVMARLPERVQAIFGPPTDSASEHAGALSVGDARILLFPVRSLAGVFAWATSVDALARFQREAAMADLRPDWQLPGAVTDAALVAPASDLRVGGSVVLEEFSFEAREHAAVGDLAAWLAANALPQTPEYAYWGEALLRKLCILPEDDFRDFLLYGTEVQTHVRLEPDSKTVATRALWTSESLPADSLLYAPLMATRARNGSPLSGAEILQELASLGLQRTQLGGDETTGQGIVALRWHSAALTGGAA